MLARQWSNIALSTQTSLSQNWSADDEYIMTKLYIVLNIIVELNLRRLMHELSTWDTFTIYDL